jgi:hypothetical protein
MYLLVQSVYARCVVGFVGGVCASLNRFDLQIFNFED